jgi:hypothetical protein
VRAGAQSHPSGKNAIVESPSTPGACSADSQADDFLRYLGEVAGFVIKDGMLYLNLRVDAGNMVFAPVGN